MIRMPELIALLVTEICITILVTMMGAIIIYYHFHDRLERLQKSYRRLRSKVDAHEEKLKKSRKTQIMNPPTEEIAPPPMAIEPEVTQPTPYAMYLDAHRALWKLQINGEDQSDYADYLRKVMDEAYAQLNATERENVEREAAESWKHV